MTWHNASNNPQGQGAAGALPHQPGAEALTQLPAFFEPELRAAYGQETDRILEGLRAQRPTTLRVNTLRATKEQVESELARLGYEFQSVAWYADAFIVKPQPQEAQPQDAQPLPRALPQEHAARMQGQEQEHSQQSRPQSRLWESALIKDGLVYVQSLSSMFPALFMRLQPGQDVLDMCAAPGGKTTQMAALAPATLHLTACEQNAVRADKLAFNLSKQGAENVVVMRQDARRLDSFFSFDRVLLDAPCSGSGTLNLHDPKLGKRFSEALVKDSCKKQAALLGKALEIVKPGGMVLYSTCSVLKRENEEIVAAALEKAAKKGGYALDPLDGHALEQQGVPLLPSTLAGALTVCPTELYEGFFMCRIVRRA